MKIAILAAALGCALMAGVYFTFSSFAMRSLGALPDPQGVAAMQSINKMILSSSFMPLFWGTTLAGVGLGVWGITHWWSPGAPSLVAGGVLYVLGMFVCTAAFNVPLNDGLDAVDATSGDAAAVWADYLVAWTRWNHARTACSLGASGLFLAAAWALG